MIKGFASSYSSYKQKTMDLNPESTNLKPELISPDDSVSLSLSTRNEVHSLYLLAIVNQSTSLHFKNRKQNYFVFLPVRIFK